MWDDNQLDRVDFIPEPTDYRILSAVDPSAKGHQEAWRGEVMGWDPTPIRTVSVSRRSRKTLANIGILVILVILFWALVKTQLFWLELDSPQSEWAFEEIGVRDLQSDGLSGEGVRVCIVDTGIDSSHTDFKKLNLEFKDFISNSNQPVDHGSLAHGTMMAGIITADGDMKGVAPNVVLGVAAALADDGQGGNSGNEQVVANAIEWCWDDFDADIISLSLGGINDPNAPRNGPTVNSVKVALSRGIFVVAAAGNDGGDGDDGRVTTPSNVAQVITVGASNRDGTVWEGSSLGEGEDFDGIQREDPHKKPEVIAPGVNIISTANQNQYYSSTGTSDSTAMVSGILALILESEPYLKQNSLECIEEVKFALMESVISLDTSNSHNQKSGYGMVSAEGWLSQIQSSQICQ